MARVLVTGAGGFIGSALVPRLHRDGHEVRVFGASDWAMLETGEGRCVACNSVDTVFHLAGRAHVLAESAADPLEEFRSVNVERTRQLGEAAAKAGVRRFVFVSSIGVHGNDSGERCIDEASPIAPVEPYAKSKWEAETALRKVESTEGLEVVAVRPPLVYGPGVKGNFLRLLRLVDSRLPLPLGSLRNRRSFVGLDNLCDFLGLLAESPGAGGQAFVVADGEDVSIPELLRMLGDGLGRRPLVMPFPPPVLHGIASIFNRGQELRQLTRSLRVDASRAQQVLGWRPEHPLRIGLELMTRWYADRVRRPSR